MVVQADQQSHRTHGIETILRGVLSQADLPNTDQRAALDNLSGTPSSPFVRQILYYGVDSIVLGTVASAALGLLEHGVQPTESPGFNDLFLSQSPTPCIRVSQLASCSLYIPTPALALRTEDAIDLGSTGVPRERIVVVLNPDYINPLTTVGNLTPDLQSVFQQSCPDTLFRQTWNCHDFDDVSRTAALLVIAGRLWQRTADIFEQRAVEALPQSESRSAASRLAEYYSALFATYVGGPRERTASIAAGIEYIEQTTRTLDFSMAIATDDIRDQALDLQRAELNLRLPKLYEQSLQTLRRLAEASDPSIKVRALGILDLALNPIDVATWASEFQETHPLPPINMNPPKAQVKLERNSAEPLDTPPRDRFTLLSLPKRIPKPDESAEISVPPNAEVIEVQRQKEVIKGATVCILGLDQQAREAAIEELRELQESIHPSLLPQLTAAFGQAKRVASGLLELEFMLDGIDELTRQSPIDQAAYDRALEGLEALQHRSARPVARAAKNALKLLTSELHTRDTSVIHYRPPHVAAYSE